MPGGRPPGRPRRQPVAPPLPAPDLVADALEEREALLATQEAVLDAEVREAHRAAGAGVPLDQWEQLDPTLRARLEALTGPTLSDLDDEMRSTGSLNVPERDKAIASLTDALGRFNDATEIAEMLRDKDEKSYVKLWDKPVGGVHHSQSRVHITQVKRQMKKGMSPTPIAPIAAAPAIACGYVTPMGDPCDKKLHTELDRYAHQQAKHKQWFAEQELHRVQDTQQAQLDSTRLLNETMARLAGGSGGDSAQVAALRAQIDELKALVLSREPAGMGGPT